MSEELRESPRPSTGHIQDDAVSMPVMNGPAQTSASSRNDASPPAEPEQEEQCERCDETKRVYKIECEHKICKNCLPEKTDICDNLHKDLCPLCQKEVLFHDNPPDSRPPPLRSFARIREIHEALHPNQCDSCQSTQKNIGCRCIDCKIYLCDDCASPATHGKNATSRHRVFTLDELKTGGAFDDVAVIAKCDMTYCQSHGSKLAQWCRSCDKGLCDVCNRDHKSHLTTNLSQRIAEMGMFVDEEKRRLEVASVALELAQNEFKKDKDKTAEEFQTIAAKVQEVAIARKTRIDQDADKLLTELNETLKDYDKRNHEVAGEVSREEANLITFRRVFEIMEEDSHDGKLNDDKILRLYSFLQANKELSDREMLHVPKVLDNMRTQAGKKWRFDESRFLFLEHINTVGTISDRSDPVPPAQSDQLNVRTSSSGRHDLDLLSPKTYTVDQYTPRSPRYSPQTSPVHEVRSPVPPISLNRQVKSAREAAPRSGRSGRSQRESSVPAGRYSRTPRGANEQSTSQAPTTGANSYRASSGRYTPLMKKSESLTTLDQISNQLPSNAQPSLFMKVLLLGDQVVGKTRLLGKLIRDDSSDKDPKPTLGLDCGARKLLVGDETIMMTIWDISGKESYRNSLQIYSKETQVIILVYDVARRNSFENLDLWLGEAKKHAPKDVQVIVVGNTELLRDHPEWIRKRRIETTEAEDWAASRCCYFTELSVRSSSRKIDDKFRQIFCDILRRRRPAAYSTRTIDRLARGYQTATRKEAYCNVQ